MTTEERHANEQAIQAEAHRIKTEFGLDSVAILITYRDEDQTHMTAPYSGNAYAVIGSICAVRDWFSKNGTLLE